MKLIHLYYGQLMTNYHAENSKQKMMIIIIVGQKYYLDSSTLSPFLFDIFLADLFLTVKDIDIATYPDDSTLFIVEDHTDNSIVSLEEVSNALFGWFKNNRLKSNPDTCHALVRPIIVNFSFIVGRPHRKIIHQNAA